MFTDHVEVSLLLFAILTYRIFTFAEVQHMNSVIEQPRKNDFFYVDYLALNESSDRRHRFIPLKVLSVTSDEVTFKVGNIAHATPVSPRTHAAFDKAVVTRNYYRKDTLTLTRQDIVRLANTGVIYNARRPDNIYIDGWIVLTEDELFVD